MRDHHHKTFLGNFLEDVHYLHAGFAVKCARRLVGKNDVGVVDDGAGNGYALHLSARKLVGAFLHLLGEPHSFESNLCLGDAFGFACACKSQRQGNVVKNVHVRDEVVTLKHEADAVVAVGVPVAVAVIFGADAVDYKVAGRVAIQAADDVEQGCFATTRRTENRHKLTFAETDGHTLESVHRKVTCHGVVFFNIFNLKHKRNSLICLCAEPGSDHVAARLTHAAVHNDGCNYEFSTIVK